MKKYIWIALTSLMVACAVTPAPPNPPPPGPPPPNTTWLVDAVSCAKASAEPFACATPIAGAAIQMHGPAGYITKTADVAGYAVFELPAPFPDSDVNITADGYVPIVGQHIDVAGTHDSPRHNIIMLASAFPAPPTRDEILNVHLTFQGLFCDTVQFGRLPWFEAALPWMTPADRASCYAAKHASPAWGPSGDTHALLNIPSGPALYDEPNQPYSSDRFGPLDWTTGGTKMVPQFEALLEEIIQAGFRRVLVFEGGDDGERGWPIAMNQLDLVHDALISTPKGDLRQFVVMFPGYDGVFYGATPDHIAQWVAKCRSLFPYCGFHHSTGHIPLGEGDGDWVNGGRMRGIDLLTSEFNDYDFGDTMWQIMARLLGPRYARPPDQPAADDPGSPFGPSAGQFYLRQQTDRGFIRNCQLEFMEYTFVHQNGANAADVQRARARFQAAGATCGG